MKEKEKLVVLGVGAHSDDLDFGAAGTFAKFAKEGADCYYLVCTDGSKGSRDPKMTPKRLAAIREKEQRTSAKLLGIKGVFFLKHKDGELVADMKLKKEIVRYIRKLKPDIVVAQGPDICLLGQVRKPYRPQGGRHVNYRRGLPGGKEPDDIPGTLEGGARRAQGEGDVPCQPHKPELRCRHKQVR